MLLHNADSRDLSIKDIFNVLLFNILNTFFNL